MSTIHALKQERDRFVAFAFASADILLELDRAGTIVYANGAILGFLDKTPEEIQGMQFLDVVAPKDHSRAMDLVGGLVKVQRVEKVELTLRGRSMFEMKVQVSGFHLGNIRDNIYLSISIPRDNNALHEEFFKRDLFSGLLKKDNFVEVANERMRQAEEMGENIRLTLLDFPDLKEVLDELPADKAAQLVAEIGEYLRSKSLDGDMAGMISEGSYSMVHDSTVNAQQLAGDILEITKKLDPRGMGLEARTSTLDTKATRLSPSDSANALLYTINKFASRQGEDFNLESLAEGYQDMLLETVEKITGFNRVVDGEEFDVAFQPIVDLRSGVIHHYESLVRLKAGSQFSNPFEFITFGEESGTIIEFDLLMVQRVIDILHEAAKNGNKPLIAVNLSGRSLSSTLFMDALEGIMAKADRRRKQVIIEITESCRIQDIKRANVFVQQLRTAGNKVCLDDFGTGESSFDYLRNIQVDFVKIDGSYVKESILTQRGREMLRAMAALCKDLGMVTIGEFVEDEKSAKFLWECNVPFGQGYFLGKPDTNIEVLLFSGKPSPVYPGIVRARDFSDKSDKKWWAKKD